MVGGHTGAARLRHVSGGRCWRSEGERAGRRANGAAPPRHPVMPTQVRSERGTLLWALGTLCALLAWAPFSSLVLRCSVALGGALAALAYPRLQAARATAERAGGGDAPWRAGGGGAGAAAYVVEEPDDGAEEEGQGAGRLGHRQGRLALEGMGSAQGGGAGVPPLPRSTAAVAR